MTASLQDLIDARRLAAETMADLDAAIARHKVGLPLPATFGEYAPPAQRHCPFCGVNNLMFRLDGLTQGFVVCVTPKCEARGPVVSRYNGSASRLSDDKLARAAWDKWNERK